MAVAKSEYEEHLFYVIFDNYVHNYVHKQLFYKTMCQRSCFNRTCEEVIIVFGEIENYFYLTKKKYMILRMQQRQFSEIKSWLFNE